jgi:predicted DNA-binding ribbon-helix-helix protein
MEKEIKKSHKRSGRHRLSLDLNQEMFDSLKKAADERYMTITKYVQRAIDAKLQLEN